MEKQRLILAFAIVLGGAPTTVGAFSLEHTLRQPLSTLGQAPQGEASDSIPSSITCGYSSALKASFGSAEVSLAEWRCQSQSPWPLDKGQLQLAHSFGQHLEHIEGEKRMAHNNSPFGQVAAGWAWTTPNRTWSHHLTSGYGTDTAQGTWRFAWSPTQRWHLEWENALYDIRTTWHTQLDTTHTDIDLRQRFWQSAVDWTQPTPWGRLSLGGQWQQSLPWPKPTGFEVRDSGQRLAGLFRWQSPESTWSWSLGNSSAWTITQGLRQQEGTEGRRYAFQRLLEDQLWTRIDWRHGQWHTTSSLQAGILKSSHGDSLESAKAWFSPLRLESWNWTRILGGSFGSYDLQMRLRKTHQFFSIASTYTGQHQILGLGLHLRHFDIHADVMEEMVRTFGGGQTAHHTIALDGWLASAPCSFRIAIPGTQRQGFVVGQWEIPLYLGTESTITQDSSLAPDQGTPGSTPAQPPRKSAWYDALSALPWSLGLAWSW